MPPSPPETTDQDREMLRVVGLRATPQRLAVLRAFHRASGRHLSADEVWQRLRATHVDIDRSTAFRAIDSLVSGGLIKEVRFHDGVARFEIQRRHHHHAVCTGCGATVDVSADAVRTLARQLAKSSGFVMSTDPQLFAGLCAACAAGAE